MVDAKIIHKDGIPYLVEAEIYSLNHKLGIIDECNRSIARHTAIIKYLVESGDNKDQSKIKKALSFIWGKIKEIARIIRDAISNFFTKIKSFFVKNKVAEKAKKKATDEKVTWDTYNIEKLSKNTNSIIYEVDTMMSDFYLKGNDKNKVDGIKDKLKNMSLGSIDDYSFKKTDTEYAMVNDLLSISKFLDDESKRMQSSVYKTCDKIEKLENQSIGIDGITNINIDKFAKTLDDDNFVHTFGNLGAADTLKRILSEFNSIAGKIMKDVTNRVSTYAIDDEDDLLASAKAGVRSSDVTLAHSKEVNKRIDQEIEKSQKFLMQAEKEIKDLKKLEDKI